jgi:NTE family protein
MVDGQLNKNNMGDNIKKVGLALQGGGAHGAFTWGVLDRLLEEDNLIAEGICGTSAGAINAVVTAYGLHIGGKEKAKNY